MKHLLERFDGRVEYVKTHAPELLLVRASLFPFDDVIAGEHAGPQRQGRDCDPEEEPFFCIEVDVPENSGRVTITFTATRITMRSMVHFTDRQGKDDWLIDDEVEMTLEGVFDFLRQLPRHAFSFTADRGR